MIQAPKIMGILNLTPDSFSDGGKFNDANKALKQAQKLEAEGANILDIGGESTGSNSAYISLEEELLRVIPILKKLRKHLHIPISIDTYKSEVARQALEEGASIINDVTALRGDNTMAKIAAKYSCPIILMYCKDPSPRTTIKAKKYKNIIETIKKFFEKRIKYADKMGIKKSKIILDPGMGQFISSIPKYSFEIISNLRELKKLNQPILIGISRKSFLGGTLQSRLDKGLIASAIAYLNGANILRTHDVKETINFFKQWK